MARTNLHLILERLTEDFAPKIRDAFVSAMRDVSDSVILADMVAAIETGDVERAFRLLGLNEAALRPVLAAISEAYETGGMVTAEAFPKRIRTVDSARFRFNVRAARAEKWLRDASSSLVSDITDKARATVRDTISRGMTEGINPRTTALDLVGRIDKATGHRVGGAIGLTPQQEIWVDRVKRDLRNLDEGYFSRTLRDKRFDDLVRKAIDSGSPLSEDQISKLVGRYRDNALRYRGEVIGRSEAIESLNRGQHESLSQAVDNGAIQRQAVKRVWDSAGPDGRTRDSHLMMDGHSVGLDEPFVFPSGARLMFPGDRITSSGPAKAIAAETIQCRCRVRLEIDFFAGVT